MKHIVAFSGGKDSTCMLLMLLEKGMPVDYVLWCDTGMEFPEMYEHIDKVDEYIQEKYGKRITRLKADKPFTYWMLEHVQKKGKHIGQKGYGWPSMRLRYCTRNMKITPVHHWMKEHGLNKNNSITYVGIAKDEPKRIKDQSYPLFDWGITEDEALKFCYDRGFRWGELYESRKRLNCWMCPMQKIYELKWLYNNRPELWKQLMAWDKEISELLSWQTFNAKDLSKLEERFRNEAKQ